MFLGHWTELIGFACMITWTKYTLLNSRTAVGLIHTLQLMPWSKHVFIVRGFCRNLNSQNLKLAQNCVKYLDIIFSSVCVLFCVCGKVVLDNEDDHGSSGGRGRATVTDNKHSLACRFSV